MAKNEQPPDQVPDNPPGDETANGSGTDGEQPQYVGPFPSGYLTEGKQAPIVKEMEDFIRENQEKE